MWMPEMLEPLKLVSQVGVYGLIWVLGTESTSALNPCHMVFPHSPAECLDYRNALPRWLESSF